MLKVVDPEFISKTLIWKYVFIQKVALQKGLESSRVKFHQISLQKKIWE